MTAVRIEMKSFLTFKEIHVRVELGVLKRDLHK